MSAPADDGAGARVGWIGAGRMGAAMVRRLLAAGVDVAVWNRTRAKAEALAAAGAQVVEAPTDLAGCDVVFTMVGGPADLTAVASGPGGVLTAPGAAPRVLVDCSTVSAGASAAVRATAAERGTAFLAAPVSGNPRVIETGNLSFVVSGPREAYEQVEPLFAAIGRRAAYVGEGEVARLVKLAHNLLLYVTSQGLAETTAMLEKHGVPRRGWLSFLNDSVVGSTFTRYKAPALVNLDWTPALTATLMRKDLDLGLAAAGEAGARLPLAEVARERAQALIDSGRADLDFQALFLLAAEACGLEPAPDSDPVDDGLSTPTEEATA